MKESRDCAILSLRNLEIGTQFRDSENAQCNLEIEQIPKLRRTLYSTNVPISGWSYPQKFATNLKCIT